MIGAGVVAGRWLHPDLRLSGAEGDWRAVSTGLRRAPQGEALAAGGVAEIRFPPSNDRGTLRLALASRPAGRAVPVRVLRDGVAVAEAVTAPESVVVAVPDVLSRLGVTVRLEAAGAEEPSRPAYLVREIVLDRADTLASWGLAAAPLLAGLAVFAGLARVSSAQRAVYGGLVAVVLVGACAVLVLDPLLGLRLRPSVRRPAWIAVALLAAADPGLRRAMVDAADGGFRRPGRGRMWAAVLPALAFAIGLWLHVPGLNGPEYWQWPWRALDGVRTAGLVGLALVPFLLAHVFRDRGRVGTSGALALVAGSVFLVQGAALGVQEEPFSWSRLQQVIEHPLVTGYHSDALSLRGRTGLLAEYHAVAPGLEFHSRTKPPGPVFFYMALVRLFGPTTGAVAGGLFLMALAAAAVPALYWLGRSGGGTEAEAFHGASLAGLAPGLLLFTPSFDAAFPAVTAVLLAVWVGAVDRGRLVWAAVAGLAFAAALFFSYSFLVLGVFLLGYAVLHATRAAVLRLGAAAALAAVVFYAALYLVSSFDPFAMFEAALRSQARLASLWRRAYFPPVLLDPLDFAMGAGVPACVLGLLSLATAWRTGERRWLRIGLLALLQVAAVDLSGLLRVEAARVWLLLLPFVAVPAGRELARADGSQKALIYLASATLLVAILRNLTFFRLA